MRRSLARAALLCAAALLVATPAVAQTATTTSVSGLITDAQGAVLPGATVTLRDPATGRERVTTTDPQGRYTFTNLPAAIYELSVALEGFKTAAVTGIAAEVTKPVVRDVMMELGGITEAVTVEARTEVLMLKQDSSVGNTLETIRVSKLPNITREATRLVALQPGTTPTGEITGARADQTTFTLDGIDVSDNIIGQTFRTVVPTPTEAVEEFRVTVANPTATFGRSSGAQVIFITKRGTNDFRGSAYEYHQDAGLNANSWTNNRLSLPKAPLVDNRFGGTVGGPLRRGRTFFFSLYEGRRNHGSVTATRLVPTATLKRGLLQFRDASGAVQTIDPKTLDPRGIGANPLILQMLALYPEANDFSTGDGLNTAGFTINIPTPLESDHGVFRLDHTVSDNWRFDGSYNTHDRLQFTVGQADLINRRAGTRNPSRPRSLSAGLTGVLSATLTSEFRFGWVHDNGGVDVFDPTPQVPGVNIALDLAGFLLDEPIDVDTQRARDQASRVDTYQFIENLTWLKRNHTMQAGFNVRRINFFHFRNDKVIGSISTPVAQLGSSTFNRIPAGQRPSFIRPADVGAYNQLYAALLGQVENITYLAARGGNLEPLPVGTGLEADSRLNAYELYAGDTWRMSPSLTLNYGLMYTWQVPPIEKDGKQVVMVDMASGNPIDPQRYLQDKFAAADRGEVYNPTLGYVPINQSGRKYAFDIDRSNFSPRASVAWNPSFAAGWLSKLFGDRRTVVRGGYSLLYDRQNTVQTVIVPTLGVGFAQTVQTGTLLNAAGQPFRAGIDGALPVPALGPTSSPIVPLQNAPSEVLSFLVDPFIKVPRNHTIDATLQRELPGDLIVEAGYVGRLGRELFQSINLNQAPYNFRDRASGQTFAEAFDAVAEQLRAGVAPAAVTPQPWFENLLVQLAPVGGSRTRALAANSTANLINGNLSSLFLALNAFSGRSFVNPQSIELFFRTSLGRSNYHAFFTTIRKRYLHGLSFDANYTFSRSSDQIGAVQNSAGLLPNSFDPDAEWGRSPFDLTHIFNSNFVYELPFGDGRRFGNFSNPFLRRLTSGWYVAGIYRATSGFPLSIVQGSQVWGGSLLLGFTSGALPTGSIPETEVNHGVTSSGGIATSGDTANRGSGVNVFRDPAAVFNSFRRLRLSQDTRSGRGLLRGLGFQQLDLSLGKATQIRSGVRLVVSLDFINVFNQVNFSDPATNLFAPATFGVVTGQRINDVQNIFPRRIQLGGRIEF
jgi:hypothetical protein